MSNLILLEDLGMKYPTEKSVKKYRYGLYKCICGKEFETQIANIKNGNTKSCGCLRGINHNLSNHKLYNTWHKMIDRCTNHKSKKYENYGGRGIEVCDRWLDINNFIEDMFPSFIEGLTLDRINNDLGYSKENCRWANQNIQSRNTRKIRANNTSGFRGVCWHKKDKKWVARVKVNNNQIILGYYKSAMDAAKAYDNYIIKNNLEHTRNF